MFNSELMNELENMWEQEQAIDRKKMLYKRYKTTSYVTKFKMMQSFIYSIRNDLVMMVWQMINKINWHKNFKRFTSCARPKNSNTKIEK